MEIPEVWEEMLINTIGKKGTKLKMSNKRGLFLTDVISKVYEKVVKEMNG